MNTSRRVASAIAALTAICAFAKELRVTVDPSQQYQTVDHFTASDAWSGNFVGQYFDVPQKSQTSKWLFSQQMGADGNPEGIGLSMWWVNAGAGTLEQAGADIMPFQRRSESFLAADGKGYDWSKCAGQRYFMEQAKRYGCNKFLLFSNSPPVP